MHHLCKNTQRAAQGIVLVDGMMRTQITTSTTLRGIGMGKNAYNIRADDEQDMY